MKLSILGPDQEFTHVKIKVDLGKRQDKLFCCGCFSLPKKYVFDLTLSVPFYAFDLSFCTNEIFTLYEKEWQKVNQISSFEEFFGSAEVPAGFNDHAKMIQSWWKLNKDRCLAGYRKRLASQGFTKLAQEIQYLLDTNVALQAADLTKVVEEICNNHDLKHGS